MTTEDKSLQMPAIIENSALVRWEKVLGPSRGKLSIVVARHLFCYICYQHLEHTFNAIGKKLNRHHTSIIYAVRVTHDRIHMKDPLYIGLYEVIMNKLNLPLITEDGTTKN